MDERQREAWEMVQALNRLWTVERRTERLREYFHPEMVAIPGNERHRIEGGDACVAAWKRFSDAARVTSWRELAPDVRLHAGGEVAIVTYEYEIAFEMGGRMFELGGRDLLVLAREAGRWWVVADHFSAYPA
jgi:ketosteroid isomerase-like protein